MYKVDTQLHVCFMYLTNKEFSAGTVYGKNTIVNQVFIGRLSLLVAEPPYCYGVRVGLNHQATPVLADVNVSQHIHI